MNFTAGLEILEYTVSVINMPYASNNMAEITTVFNLDQTYT